MSEIKNTSGHGKMADVPKEIKGWSWGAFLLTWIWGIGNSTYRAFWCVVPIVNIFMWIALGIKGREWAWRNRRWDNIEHFKRVQKRWGIAGLIVVVVIVCLYTLTFLGVFSILNHAAPTKMAIRFIQQNTQFQHILGTPIKRTSNALGNIETSGGMGQAQMSFSISGSNIQGLLSYQACEMRGQWYLYKLTYVDNRNTANNIQIKPESGARCNA